MSSRFDGYHDSLAFIEARSGLARGFITLPTRANARLELGLQRTRALLDALGAPDRSYPIVHIAGSKGKGSTAAFTAAIGRAAGYRTGRSTSPHLHSYRERIAIDDESISQHDFTRTAETVAAATERLEQERPDFGNVTAFELLTVMALVAFADAGCDLAVVEVGLGGTFDSTNVVTPAVSAITRLDLEHTQVLGDTLAEIAANKAGIIKNGVPVVTARQEPEAFRVIEAVARHHGAPLFVAKREFDWSGDWRSFEWHDRSRSIAGLRTGMPGNHQMENAALSLEIWEQLSQVGRFASDDAIRTGLVSASIPARFERVEIDGRSWVFDGAHTPVAAAALSEAILSEFGRPVGVIVGMLQDKHPEPFFAALAPAIDVLIVTAPRNPRAIPAGELTHIARQVDSQTISSQDIETALNSARAVFPADLPIVITGSFSLVAEARECLGLALSDRPARKNPAPSSGFAVNTDQVD